jgi:recombination protein RecT
MEKPEVMNRFRDIFPNEQVAKSYIQSVLILVASDDKLADCTPRSIFVASLRAASLGLSCDPALKQAWIVPYNKRIKGKNGQADTWIKEAQFQPHYLGLYNLAMRTGKYKVIHVSPIHEGARVLENTLTGIHYIEEGGLISMPANPNAVYRDVTTRRKKDLKVIGWLAYFMTLKGHERSEYMSVAEIDDHAQQYVKDYDKNPNWQNSDKRAVMEMKTVFKKLTNWMDLSGEENRKLAEALRADEPETIDAPVEDVPTETPAQVVGQMTYAQAVEMRAETPWGNLAMGALDRDRINDLYWHEITTDEQREALRLILKEEYQMDPPEAPKRSTEEKIKELMP